MNPEVLAVEERLHEESRIKQTLFNICNGEEMLELLEDVENMMLTNAEHQDLNKQEGSILIRIQKLLKNKNSPTWQ